MKLCNTEHCHEIHSTRSDYCPACAIENKKQYNINRRHRISVERKMMMQGVSMIPGNPITCGMFGTGEIRA